MSEENVEMVHRVADAFNRHDLDAFLALIDPDIEFRPLIFELEGSGSFRGHDGIRRWWETFIGTFPDFSGEVEDVRDLGDVTVARARLRGHGVESRAPMEQTFWQVAEWREKKVVRWLVFASEAEALEAAGLSE